MFNITLNHKDIAESSASIKPQASVMLHKHSSDEELIIACRRGERLAQKYLYERYYGRMKGIALRYTRNEDEAIDIINVGFMKVFNALDRYEPHTNLNAWISRIIFNAAIDFIRRETKFKKDTYYPDMPIESPMQNEALSNLGIDDIFALIQKLPIQYRTVFSLYVIDGFKHSEIVELLDIPLGSSKYYLSKAREMLQELITTQHGIAIARK